MLTGPSYIPGHRFSIQGFRIRRFRMLGSATFLGLFLFCSGSVRSDVVADSPRIGNIKGTKESSPTDGRGGGGLNQAVIHRVIRVHIHEIKRCYENRLKNKPGLQGRVVAQFAISPEGNVEDCTVKDSTLNDAEVEQCIASAVKKWEFPRPKGGKTVVSYPFVFEAVDDGKTPEPPKAPAPPPAASAAPSKTK